MSSSVTTNIFLISLFLILFPTGALAFGAGDIPDFAYLNDKAFRHGDIENILENLAKTAGHAATGGGLLGLAHSVLNAATGGAKFNKSDIKKVYFGNWLRDYSQAMDIAGLSKLTADTLVLVVSVLGFMTFGFATEEFKVTPDRLGVYLPVEHIDNPKGYSEKEGDARNYHPKLRPPVDRRELEIDPRTGMKNYIATEGQSWDTSTAHIRRTFRACIDYGRRARGSEGADLWEAYRLLGTGLHTMEDLLAHSNWCELTLRKMGHKDVFCHVGDSVFVDTPNGRAPPLVTGTFGGADFLHSLMGEATDKISQSSVTDLSEKMNSASKSDNSQLETLKDLIGKLPIGGGSSSSSMAEGANLQQQSKAYHFDPNNAAPPEVQQQMATLLKWHDDTFRDISKKIESIPGLTDLLENITNALNAYVYSILAPWISPILQQATEVLGEGSKAVIDSDDQYEVFNNPNASDPSHSLLSKDHFGLILNEPAGKIAQLVVVNTVNLIVDAWFNDGTNPDQVIDQILEAFHHPYYATGRSRIQQAMYEGMDKWLGGLGSTEAGEVLQALTKESVRNGKNKRKSEENTLSQTSQSSSQDHGPVGGGYSTTQNQYGGSDGYSGYQGRDSYSGRGNRDDSTSYDTQTTSYGRSQGYGSGRDESDTYSGRSNRDDNASYGQTTAYGRSQGYGSGRDESDTYSGRSNRDDNTSYGTQTTAYGRPQGYGSGRDESDTYSGGSNRDDNANYGTQTTAYGRSQGYGSRRDENDTYSGRSNRDDNVSYGTQTTAYGRPQDGRNESDTYSGRNNRDQGDNSYQSSYDRSSQGYGGETTGFRRGNDSYGRDEESRGYGGNESYGSSGYGRNTSRNEDEQLSHGRSYDQPSGYSGRSEYNHSEYSSREETSGYGEEGAYEGREESRGYGNQESYNQGRNEEESTFGAERLSIGNEYGGGEGRSDYGY